MPVITEKNEATPKDAIVVVLEAYLHMLVLLLVGALDGLSDELHEECVGKIDVVALPGAPHLLQFQVAVVVGMALRSLKTAMQHMETSMMTMSMRSDRDAPSSVEI